MERRGKFLQKRFKIQVCTTISRDFRDFLASRNITVSSALARGIRSFMESENPEKATTEELLHNIANLQRILTRVNEEKYKLEEEVRRLKAQKGQGSIGL